MGAFVYLLALFNYLLPPLLSHRPPHPEADSVGAVPFIIFNFGTISSLVWEKNFFWTTGARNTTHKNTENTGAGLSYSGRNGQWRSPS
jgi:hypothetical protein